MKSNSVINAIYEHLDPLDWEDGIDIYKSGKIEGFNDYSGLISVKMESESLRKLDVRLKIHPNREMIQWFECSCFKNRRTGAFCEHLIALLLQIDREAPKLFEKLNRKMPLKLPKLRKKANPLASLTIKTASDGKKQPSPFQSFVDKGSIFSISHQKNTGNLVVKFEIKEGIVDSFVLSIDDSAKLISGPKYKDLLCKKTKALKVFKTSAFPSIHIYKKSSETLMQEKVVSIKQEHDSDEVTFLSESNTKNYKTELLCDFNSESKIAESKYLLIAFNFLENKIGNDYIFLPSKGYFRIDDSVRNNAWKDLPLKKIIGVEEYGNLVATKFDSILKLAKVLGPLSLKNEHIISPQLLKIDVKKVSDGWYSLDPTYKSGNSQISMLKLLAAARKSKGKFVSSEGKWFQIPEEIRDFSWSLDKSKEALELDALGLLRFKASIGDFDSAEGTKEVIAELRQATSFVSASTSPDISNTALDLRPYQHTALKWLWWLYLNNLHGLLADDMGLGKTHQAMALMSSIQNFRNTTHRPKFLVICPTTVLEHWDSKVREFSPNLSPVVYHGSKRELILSKLSNDKNLLITSYGIMLRDIDILSKMSWEVLILDEAHFIKNKSTATYKAVCKISSKIRVGLTGTPIENDLTELKTLFDFLVPGYLGSDEFFRKKFIIPLSEKDRNIEQEIKLQKLINPLKMRRTKKQVLKDLPEKIEDLRYCLLSDDQVGLYREVVAIKAQPLIDQLNANDSKVPYLHVFATLQLLKQICNHPALVTQNHWKSHKSGKFELLKELLQQALASGHKVVIFSQYVKMITIISSYLEELSVGHVVLTGASKNRGQLIDTFQTQETCRVFIGSLMAGGVGIDLTAASVVIHFDRWWNASKENQATDRVHRIGQKRSVQVIKLVTRGTLEEKIDQLINSKQDLFEKFMNKDEELFKNLSKQQLIELLSE